MLKLVLKQWDCWPVDEQRHDYSPVEALDAEDAAESFVERHDHMAAEGVTDEMLVCVALVDSDVIERYRVRGEVVATYRAEPQS